MQFRVPQFIDIEDKILGPLTWKQAAYCLGAAGTLYISLRFTDSKILALLFAAPVGGLFLCLAFVKINNQSFVEVLEHAFTYFTSSNLYTWQKDAVNQNRSGEADKNITVEKAKNKDLIPTYTKKSLSDIASGLDTKME
jgi:hypothetical protein